MKKFLDSIVDFRSFPGCTFVSILTFSYNVTNFFNGLILHEGISMAYPEHWFFKFHSEWKQ